MKAWQITLSTKQSALGLIDLFIYCRNFQTTTSTSRLSRSECTICVRLDEGFSLARMSSTRCLITSGNRRRFSDGTLRRFLMAKKVKLDFSSNLGINLIIYITLKKLDRPKYWLSLFISL